MPFPQVRTIALATGIAASLAAVTAFGVAPLTAPALPASELASETVTLQPERLQAQGGFLQQETVRRGDTLSSLKARLGIDDPELATFVRTDPIARRVLELRAGRTVSAYFSEHAHLQQLTYRLDAAEDDEDALGRRLVIRRLDLDGKLVAYDEPVPIERTIETRSAVVQRSLIEALDTAEIPDNVVTRMADIFGTDVDLQRDVRPGDRLRVVYETLREAGSLEPPIVGRILAVQFRGGNRKLEAVWFDRGLDDSGGYYTFDGRSLERPFLASPLEFTRISSSFSRSRLHPVLRDWRAHKGVDLPAPIGTNVRTTADGVIDFIGWQNGYGKVIVVKHGDRLTTLYAHLHRFAKGLEPGSRVRQGQVIGTVGQTGWATGPHLHFEFHVDGRHVDPMVAVQPAPVRQLSSEERARFATLASQYRERFGLLDSQVAARFE